MSSHFYSSPHANTVKCLRCGKTGAVVWEEVCRPEGKAREFVRIDGDFHERLARKAPYPIEVVCNGCGSAQAGPLQ